MSKPVVAFRSFANAATNTTSTCCHLTAIAVTESHRQLTAPVHRWQCMAASRSMAVDISATSDRSGD